MAGHEGLFCGAIREIAPHRADSDYLVDIDKEPGAVILRAPVTVMVVMGNEFLVMTVIIPITRLVVGPRVMMIVSHGGKGATHGEKSD
jgi:hypothetical protein